MVAGLTSSLDSRCRLFEQVESLESQSKIRAVMILQVHDELLFEAPHGEVDRLQVLVRKAMEQVHELAVPLVVDLKAGPNWRDMK